MPHQLRLHACKARMWHKRLCAFAAPPHIRRAAPVFGSPWEHLTLVAESDQLRRCAIA